MKNFEWADAATVDEAVQLTVKGGAYKAAGMDLVDLMKERLYEPTRLVNIRNIAALNFVREDAQAGLLLGPLVTLTELSNHDVVRQKYAALAQAAAKAATPQVRNVATLGGNLLQRPRCWYFRNEQFPCRKKGGEICYAQQGENQYHAIFNNGVCAIVHPSAAASPLIAFGAKLHLQGPKEKREVPLEQFLVLPNVDVTRENQLREGELITQVSVPTLQGDVRSTYIKQGEKESFDWPIAEVTVVMERDGDTCRRASVILGAIAPVPRRAKEAEAMLNGQKVTEDLARQAAEASLADASPMTLNGYKVPLFKALIARAILSTARGEAARGEETRS